MDKADIAGDLIEESTAANIAKQTQAIQPVNNTPDCLECGEEIPAARREALPGCAHCIECQQLLDTANRNYR